MKRLVRDMLREIYGETQPVHVLAARASINSWHARVALGDLSGPVFYVKLTRRGPQYYIGGNWVEGRPSVAARHQLTYENHLPPGVCVANVILANDEKRLLATEAVPGANLKYILTKRRPPGGMNLEYCMALAGRALAAWHWMDKRPTEPSGIQIQRYLDFSVWNVLVDSHNESITVLDFPGAVAMGSPYEDIATFLHSLLVVRHHPLTRIKRVTWWDWRDTFAWFLRGYCEAAYLPASSLNADEICSSLREIVECERTKYEERPWNPRSALERAWYARLTTDAGLSPATLMEIVSSVSRGTGIDGSTDGAGTARVIRK